MASVGYVVLVCVGPCVNPVPAKAAREPDNARLRASNRTQALIFVTYISLASLLREFTTQVAYTCKFLLAW